jgi:hypothetical protein
MVYLQIKIFVYRKSKMATTTKANLIYDPKNLEITEFFDVKTDANKISKKEFYILKYIFLFCIRFVCLWFSIINNTSYVYSHVLKHGHLRRNKGVYYWLFW